MSNKVITNSTSITLAWTTVSGANKYRLQVSDRPDFANLLVDDATLTSATKTFTDTGADDSKRWWRWRYSTDGGTTWKPWREVAHYWLMAGATELSTPSAAAWYLVTLDTTEEFTIDPFPRFSIHGERINRSKTRNRAGELLSDFLTVKDHVVLDFPADCFIEQAQWHDFRRFDQVDHVFFLVVFKDNGEDALVPHIWRVEFEQDPQLSVNDTGADVRVGTFYFAEV